MENVHVAYRHVSGGKLCAIPGVVVFNGWILVFRPSSHEERLHLASHQLPAMHIADVVQQGHKLGPGQGRCQLCVTALV